jgi:hypothetical protein
MSEESHATAIRNYWKERGYTVDVTVRDITIGGHYRAVRSNMVNGLPHNYQRAAAEKVAV